MARYYFLACFIFTSCLVAGQSTKYALKGAVVHFRPDVSGQPNTILWKHKGNKVVELDSKKQVTMYSPFEGRVTLNSTSAELQITGLRFEDSGEYECEVEINKKLDRRNYALEVIDKVAMPTISCEMNDASGIQATLVCSAEPRPPQSPLKFEWRSRGKPHPRPNYTISLGDKHDEEVYSCSVSNPLSNETATFTAKECYPDSSSSVALIVSLVITGLVIIPLVVGGIVYRKRKQKACFAEGGVKKQSPTRVSGSEEETAQGDEKKALIYRAPILPSDQPLSPRGSVQGQIKDRIDNLNKCKDARTPLKKGPGFKGNKGEHEETFTPPSSSLSDPRHHANINNEDEDPDQQEEPAEKHVPQSDPCDPKEVNEHDPAESTDRGSASASADEDERPKEAGDVKRKIDKLNRSLKKDGPTPLRRGPGEDQKTDQDEGNRRPVAASITPSTPTHDGTVPESITGEHKGATSPPSPPRAASPPPQVHHANMNDSDAEPGQPEDPTKATVPQSEPSNSEEGNEQDPACVSDGSDEDGHGSAPEESEKKSDEGQEASPAPAGPDSSSTDQPPSSATTSPPDLDLKNTDGEHREESVSEPEKKPDEDTNASSAPAGPETSAAHPS
uniref:nucleolar and coiled-body phosphoprotein 1-like isoform X2 n=1 Tax=Semicossyphus pulcher TaxID=241346 RepID=UPI0037E8A9D6